MKKILLISLGIIVTALIALGVVRVVQKPAVPSPTPAPTPAPTPQPSATAAPILEVNPVDACSTTLVVACVSPSPSGSPLVSPSPSSSTTPGASLSCVSKRMYQDDSRNRAGFYYLEKEITDASTVQDGQMIVYNVTAHNSGGEAASDTTVTDKLSTNLTYVDGDGACTYDNSSRVVTCTIGALAGSSEAGRSFRTKVSVSGPTSVANTAEVSSSNGQRSSCSVQINATTGQVQSAAPASSPAPTALPVAGVFEVTAGTLGVGFLFLIVGALGLLLI